jgi:hypothetical protein
LLLLPPPQVPLELSELCHVHLQQQLLLLAPLLGVDGHRSGLACV